VLYAFVLSRDAQPTDVPVVPVLNIPRADLSLRPDAEWLLTEVCGRRFPGSPHTAPLLLTGLYAEASILWVYRQSSRLRLD